MISPEIQYYLKLAEESHEVAKTLMDLGHVRFSAAQSYYTFLALPFLTGNWVKSDQNV